MSNNISAYRQIAKATSIFGGVQVFNIIIQVVRAKLVAILLGTVGMGINGLLLSTMTFIGGLTNFGLGVSAVKNVSEANANNNPEKVSIVIAVLRRLVWISGLVGATITIFLSGYLSKLTFGNYDYKYAFIWLSVTLLFNQLSTGQIVLLQGLRKLKYLANASVTGAILGVTISIPIYYYYGVKGIVPAIIVSSILSMLRSWYFSRKVKISRVNITKEHFHAEGKSMIKMGVLLSISAVYVLFKNYVIRAFISNQSGVEQVGLYSAGFAIITTYVGMVFSAMGTDYYPRLSGVSSNNRKSEELINQQAEMAILLLAPIVILFIILNKWVILILYTKSFLDIELMLKWAALGMIFRSASWSMAFVFLAKGDSKLYTFNELFGGTVTFAMYLLGYYFGGLTGWGISFFIGNLYYAIQVYYVVYKNYKIKFQKEFHLMFLIQFALCLLSLIAVLNSDNFKLMISLPFFVISTLISFKKLDKRLQLKTLLSSKISYFKKN